MTVPSSVATGEGTRQGRTAQGRTASGRTASGRTASGRTASGRTALVALLLALTAVLLVRHLAALGPSHHLHWTWWELAPAFLLTEALTVPLEFRDRQIHSFTLNELPLLVGLLFAPPLAVVVARVAGSGLCLLVQSRRSPAKGCFNLAMYAAETAAAAAAYRLVGPGPSAEDTRTFLACLAAVAVADVLSLVAVSAVIRWHGGRTGTWAPAAMAAAEIVANTAMGLVGVVLVERNRAAVVLIAALAVVVVIAYRGHAALRQRLDGVEVLYDFTQAVSEATGAEDLLAIVAERARALMQAAVADVVVLDGLGPGIPARHRSHADGATTPHGDAPNRDAPNRDAPNRDAPKRDAPDGGPRNGLPIGAPPQGAAAGPGSAARGGVDPLVLAVIAAGAPLSLGPASTLPEHRAFLDRQGWKDAVITPIGGDAGPIGALVVAQSLADVGRFAGAGLRLLETLANHASVALRNGRLVERLQQEVREREHQALHDPLTGLANRTFFRRRVDDTIAVAGSTGAVLLIDLDRFKDVNDTLGHHHGDRLLVEVARRLVRTVGPHGTVARLSGDEFAVLLPEVGEGAEAVAERLRAALVVPVRVEEMALDVAGSIGIAVWPEHGASASELLKCADVAMYGAKGTDAGVRMYRPDDDRHTRERLGLTADLRRAMDTGQIEVHFQPKAEVRSGRVVGMEALVRWHHPVLGFVPPETFIPVVEQTGLIGSLTRRVLQESLRACRQWRDRGFDLSVAVNIAARTLLDATLPEDVGRQLQLAGVPPEALILEITETGIMADPGRSIGVLTRLAGMGVRLSIDDFGTGYSSLSYLQRLPVQEVKIDRTFVARMAVHAPDRAIVRSITELSHSLGKTTVAEGVEDHNVWRELHRIGCDQLQGFVLSQPVTGPDLLRWLEERRPQPTPRAPLRVAG